MNLLYYGDNLDVLGRHIDEESVDLVYLDPPFNSNASLGGGLTVASQPEELADGHYLLTSTLGGVSLGVHVIGGIHLTPTVSVSGEVELDGSGLRDEALTLRGWYRRRNRPFTVSRF